MSDSSTRVLVFSPHPDDVELFVGGTLLRHLNEGARVRIVMMTLGEKGSILSILSRRREQLVRRMRAEELAQRFERAPGMQVMIMGIPDREIAETELLRERVREQLEEFLPTCVYVPESTREASYYTHPDHLTTGRIVEAVAAALPQPVRVRYFHSKRPTTYVDVTPFEAENLAALRCYRSQYQWTASPPFLLHLLERDRRRRLKRYGQMVGAELAEAFRES